MEPGRERTLTDIHGVEVFHRTWSPAEPRGVVVIAHGMSEHSGRYARFAGALTDAGWAVCALDHRGHGRTGDTTGAGKVGAGGGTALLDDIEAVVELARTEVPDAPVVLFGHSMGSMLAQAYVENRGSGLAGYVLSGCPGPMEGADEIAAGLAAAVDGGMVDEPIDILGPINAPFEPARTPFDWLSRDDAEVDAYLADRYCGPNNPMTYGFLLELFRLAMPAMEAEAVARVPRLPVLMVTGEMDAASNMAAGARELEKRLRDAGLDVTSRYYPDARHEVLNETNRDEVTADIVAWLARLAS